MLRHDALVSVAWSEAQTTFGERALTLDPSNALLYKTYRDLHVRYHPKDRTRVPIARKGYVYKSRTSNTYILNWLVLYDKTPEQCQELRLSFGYGWPF